MNRSLRALTPRREAVIKSIKLPRSSPMPYRIDCSTSANALLSRELPHIVHVCEFNAVLEVCSQEPCYLLAINMLSCLR